MGTMVIVLFVSTLLFSVVALFLPRKWVAVSAKRWILGAWILLGGIQILDGFFYLPSKGGASTMLYGLSEVMMFGAGYLMFTERRWKKGLGTAVIFLGLFLLMVAGALRSSGLHG